MSDTARKLPIGSAMAAIDYHANGEWPGAIPCRPCCGTGNFYGRDEDGDRLECDDCQGRGWNPPVAESRTIEER